MELPIIFESTYNIIQIQNNVSQNWQYYVDYSIIHAECEEYSVECS